MLRVAVDVTPLLGRRTGIGTFVAGFLGALLPAATTGAAGGPVPAASVGEGLDLCGYAMSWRGRRQVAAAVPHGMRALQRPMPAGLVLRLWPHTDLAPAEWWTGEQDVVHGTNFVVPPTRRAARVVTVHDLTCIRFPELCTPASLRYPALIRRAIAGGALVHALSQTMADEIVDLLGAHPDQVRVAEPAFAPAGGPGGAPGGPGGAPGGPEGAAAAPYVLGLGTVEPRKDFPLLVRAFDLLADGHPELELRLAGVPGWGEQALAAAVAEARHRDRIHRLGWAGDIGALLAGARVFAYPSVYEGFGIPPLEAMAAGVPVVATAAGAVPEVVGDAGVLVPVGDAEALAAALEAAVVDEAERARLIRAGRERVTRFSWARTAAGLAQLYHDAATGYRGRPAGAL